MEHTHQRNCAINTLLQKNTPVSVKKRELLLNSYQQKQPFRVAIGKSKWINYEVFNPNYDLREILKDEIVIEFDTENKNISWEAINFTGINLLHGGFTFEVWDHNGRSPHLHIHNLPIANLEKDKLRAFKKFFIKKFVPVEYEPYVDTSLCGIHLVSIEYQEHWKKCYGIKKLLWRFE